MLARKALKGVHAHAHMHTRAGAHRHSLNRARKRLASDKKGDWNRCNVRVRARVRYSFLEGALD
jgi:hypothetical protein